MVAKPGSRRVYSNTGFAVLGGGISLTFPALLAEAGSGAERPAEGIGAVSTGGYLGFLGGPPAIGGLAELTSLPLALWVIPLLAAGAALLVRPSPRNQRGQRRRPTMPVS